MTGQSVDEVIGLLADETRLSILRALATRQAADPTDPVVGFADLQRAVAAEDSGNFSYHLGKLLGRYVRKTDAGYLLTDAGTNVASALVAGTLATEPLTERETPYDCPVCDAPIVARSTTGGIAFTCEAGHGLREVGVPPAAIRRDIETVLRLASRRALADLEIVGSGSCARCYGAVDWTTVDLDESVHETVGVALLRASCTGCGMVYTSPVALWALADWAVRSRLFAAGVDVREVPPWELPALATTTVREGDPRRFAVTVDAPEPFTVVVDERATVLAVE